MTDPSPRLRDLAFAVLDLALSFALPAGGGVAPFIVLETAAGERRAVRFAGDWATAQQLGRECIARADDAVLAAIAWDGYVTVDGEHAAALLVEASQRLDPASVVLAQRYVPVLPAGGADILGEPLRWRGKSLFG